MPPAPDATNIGYRAGVTVLQTLLVLAVIPAAIYGVVVLIVLWPKFVNRPRYRAGQEWNFPPVFWVADPGSVNTSSPPAKETDTGTEPQLNTARGGARGNW